jgi:GTPase SAR1 family protein
MTGATAAVLTEPMLPCGIVDVRDVSFAFALVGYTNAGKSSLMRALTGSEVLVEDELFATLDNSARLTARGEAARTLRELRHYWPDHEVARPARRNRAAAKNHRGFVIWRRCMLSGRQSGGPAMLDQASKIDSPLKIHCTVSRGAKRRDDQSSAQRHTMGAVTVGADHSNVPRNMIDATLK